MEEERGLCDEEKIRKAKAICDLERFTLLEVKIEGIVAKRGLQVHKVSSTSWPTQIERITPLNP